MYNNIQVNILTLHTSSIPGVGSQGEGHKLCENLLIQNVVMLHNQIKANEKYDNIQANILILHTPSIPGVGSKVVMLHIKL